MSAPNDASTTEKKQTAKDVIESESSAKRSINQSAKSVGNEGSSSKDAEALLKGNVITSRKEALGETLRNFGTQRERPVDLSERYKPDDNPWSFDDSCLNRWVSCLEEYRVLVLLSPLSKALNSAAALLNNEKFMLGKNRFWNLHRPQLQNATTWQLLDSSQECDSGSAFVVSGQDGPSTSFLFSLPEDPCTTLKRSLQEKNAYMLILLRPEQLEGLPKDKGVRASQYLEKVPWLEPMLEAECPNEAAAYLKRIRDLGSRWSHEPSQILGLAKRKEFDAAFKALDGTEATSPSTAGPRDGETIENTIKFIVCYFGGSVDTSTGLLSPEDFHFILRALLGEQTVDEPAQVLKDQNGTVPPINTRPLIEVWKAGSQRIAERCGMRVERDTEKNLPYVDFKSPATRAALVYEFEGSHIWTYSDLCNRVARTGLLFEERSSVRTGAVKLALQQIESDPSGYGRSFLTAAIDEAHLGVAGLLPDHVRNGLAALLDAAAAKDVEPIPAALKHLADSKGVYEAWRLAVRFKSVPKLSRTFTDLLKRVLDESPVDPKRDEALEEAVNELLNSLSIAPASSGAAIREILSWGIDTQWVSAASSGDSSHNPSKEFAFKLLFKLHAFSPLPSEVREPAWRLLLAGGVEKWFDAIFPSYENVLVYFVEWIIGRSLDPLPEGNSLAVAVSCLQKAFEGFPKTLTPADTADYLRAVFASRWIPRESDPPETAGVQDLLRRLIPDRLHRQKIRDDLQVLYDAAAAGAFTMDSLQWEGADQRKQRLQLQARFRDVRDMTRQARKAFSTI